MIEPLKPKQSLKVAELQDGDIICFQRTSDKSADQARALSKSLQEPCVSFSRLHLGSPPADGTRRTRTSEHFEDAREYYDFLEHKRTVRFHPHTTRCDQAQYPPFDLVLNAKINYDALAERVGAYLSVPPTHVRLWTVNATTSNPKAPVRRGTNPSLRQILNPMGSNTTNSSQRTDAFYFEVLEISLAELDTKKSIKVTWLSEGITKEVRRGPVALCPVSFADSRNRISLTCSFPRPGRSRISSMPS